MTNKEFWTGLAFLCAVLGVLATIALGGCKKAPEEHQYIFVTAIDSDEAPGFLAVNSYVEFVAHDQNGSVYNCKWASSDSDVAYIQQNGILWGEAPGRARIVVSCPMLDGRPMIGSMVDVTVFNPEGEQ